MSQKRSIVSYLKWPLIVTFIGLVLSAWLGWETEKTLSAARTVPTSKNEKTALSVFSVSQPNQADNTKPTKVTIKGHFR